MARTATTESVVFPVATALRVVGLQVLLVVHAILQLLDLGTTFMALNAGGIEANPISRSLIDGGWLAYGSIKIVVAAAFLSLWPIGAWLEARETRLVAGLMAAFALFMGFVVVNNARIAL
jgi:hypothetical protein